MAASDSPREFATEVVQRLTDAGYRALWAGGCVRDFLLGICPKDYDIATNALPDDVQRIFGKRFTQMVGANFGVTIVRGPKKSGYIEVATFRTDGSYLDGRRPETVTFSTPEEDAQRRDFTINGMFYDPLSQQVIDYVNGERDLARKVVRAIGDPHDRMREDKLRMLRAVRFTATLDFELDTTTADAIRKMSPEIYAVSIERITQELQKILLDEHRLRGVQLTNDVGLLRQFLPELQPVLDGKNDDDKKNDSSLWEITLHQLGLLQEPSFSLAMATLLSGIAMHEQTVASEVIAKTTEKKITEKKITEKKITEKKITEKKTTGEKIAAVCRRLRMSNNEIKRISWLLEHCHTLDTAVNWPLCRLKRLAANAGFAELLALLRVRLLATNHDLQPLFFIEKFLEETPPEKINPPELLTGDDLVRNGWQPGPQFKAVLTAVRDAQLNEDIATAAEATAFVQQLFPR